MSALPFHRELWQHADALSDVGGTDPAGGTPLAQRRRAAPVPAAELPIAMRRRRDFSPEAADPRASVGLYDEDGVLRWIYRPPRAQALRRRGGITDFSFGTPLQAFVLDRPIGPNQVTQGLEALDAQLTPRRGLQRWTGQGLQPVLASDVSGPTLLLVHGTFSSSDMWFQQLGAAGNAAGQALLAQWRAAYGDNILAFDHATLSVTPWLNALDLADALAGVDGPIDVLCHSRGGLVVAWLLRLAALPVRQAVFVGSPLNGTSLASPHRLRHALDLLANAANALALAGAAAGTVLPLAAGAAGLAKVLGQTLKLGAALPLADAAVALVPGLASQQRTTNNAETQRLFSARWRVQPRLAVVSADFQPNAGQPAWKFWTRLCRPGLQLLDAGADLVFPGANDLVVDTDTMAHFGTPPGVVDGVAEHLALGATASTWHTNYFADARVVAFLADRLRG